jgi:hypothetical protein
MLPGKEVFIFEGVGVPSTIASILVLKFKVRPESCLAKVDCKPAAHDLDQRRREEFITVRAEDGP